MRRLEFGDMVFYALTGLIVILLLWLRFLEEAVGLWGAWVVWVGWSVFLMRSFWRTRNSKTTKASSL